MSPDELQRYLESLPEKLERELEAVSEAQARRLSDAQRAELQSQQQSPDETGDLEASCRVEKREDGIHVVAGGESTTTEVRTGSGEPYDYALSFEFGNSRQAARPFFWSTYRVLKPSIDEEISKTVERVLDDR